MTRARRALAIAAAALLGLATTGCGLQPLYDNGGHGVAAHGLAAVEVPAIPGKSGWLMRNALVDRLHAGGDASPLYRLDVTLDDKLEGLGLLSNNTVERERRTLRARYQLVDIASGRVLLDASTGWDAGLDVTSSEYATVAAENTALENLVQIVADHIVTRVSLQMRVEAHARQAGQP
ncbi:MAG: hypothetical protein KGK11_02660 [Sphingomonadales bacterium]|nr:hypothetical protein [Sphingomonadales bacterium]